MRHKHYDCIVAWAEGKTIEVLQVGSGRWLVNDEPQWQTHVQYRIQPEPRPDHYQQYRIDEHGMPWLSGVANLRLHFDGETGKLKAAEVI
jgi:hypothetical protein